MTHFHLILTLDYELFGNGSGCLEHCVSRPTDACLNILKQFEAPMAFFVDASEFRALKSYPEPFACGMAVVESQLQAAVEQGHKLQLHLHPQWLGANYEHGQWQLDMSKWRIGDLSSTDMQQCVDEGLDYLREVLAGCSTDTSDHLQVFRAGGWAIQPSAKLVPILSKAGIRFESTVAPNAYNPAAGDWFDFRRCSTRPSWPIDTDVCLEGAADSARLIEVPIATAKVSKLSHYKALKENRSGPAFPSGCVGSYAGANTKSQEMLGKFSKLLRLGYVMLDFSTMPGWMLIDISKRYLQKFAQADQPVPLVAIGHNKNFTEQSQLHLRTWLQWVADEPAISLSTYQQWYSAYRGG